MVASLTQRLCGSEQQDVREASEGGGCAHAALAGGGVLAVEGREPDTGRAAEGQECFRHLPSLPHTLKHTIIDQYAKLCPGGGPSASAISGKPAGVSDPRASPPA